MSTAAERQEATFSNSMVSMASTLTRSTTATASAMQTLNTSLTRAMMNKKSNTVHAWHGGCSSSQTGGWNNLCLDRNTYDNAMPYFRKRDNTRFLVVDRRVVIFYNFFTINSSCNWAYSDLMINSVLWYRTHGHTSGWNWKDSHGKAPLASGALGRFSLPPTTQLQKLALQRCHAAILGPSNPATWV